MIGDITEDIKAVGQIVIKPLFIITLASGALLYILAYAVATTGLANSLTKYRTWIGFTLLTSCAYLLAHGLAWVFNVIGSLLDGAQMRKVRRKWLATLTPDERVVLAPYIRDQAASVTYNLNDGAVRGLGRKRVLYRTSSASHGFEFPFNM